MRRKLAILTLCLAALLAGKPAQAVKIADITRLSGQRSNVMTGLGLVIGLKGTGDGGDFQPAIKPLASMLAKFADQSTIRELTNVQNVALVSITATVPPSGVRSGDKLDVHVTSIGASPSLKGGRLFVTPMQGPIPGSGILALAEGPISIEDPTVPTHAIVKGGAVMEEDLPAQVIENGKITLILENPATNWTTASTIAKIINDAEGTGEILAVAKSEKYVEVTIPLNERERPDSFISRIQRYPVPLLPTEARVVINERTGTIIMTGDVEISPVVISHKGLTITTVTPPPTPTPRNPVTTEKTVVALDTASQGGAKLQDLVNALDMIKVPAEDRITIIKQLYESGKLHAKLKIE
ncbi:MAG: flagellar basal body P-ring protein FlgI [Bacillota bacterium]